MIAGLEEPTGGAILLDDEDITPVPTHQRNLGMVFQSLALFPHLSVGDNIAYALRIRGASRDEQEKRVDELLKLVHLPGFADRPVAKLSGGQRQRVAIARALALSPKLFLLDEPLSALDAKLREAMQVELRQLQQRLGITTIVVTHDQREAMTMADLVVVMGNGKIRQAASPIEIYRKPADAFVADFIGSTNLLDVSGRQRRPRHHPRPCHSRPSLAGRLTKASVSIRPEDVHLAAPGGDASPARVTFVRDLGGTIETFVEAGGTTIIAVATPRERPDVVGRPDGRRRAAARKLRGAEAMRREAANRSPTTRRCSFPALMLIVFFVVPFSTMIAVSFFKRDPAGFYTTDFVLRQLRPLPLDLLRQRARLLADAGGRSSRVCCVVVAFPFTYLLTKRPRRVQTLWLVGLLSVLSLSEVIIGFAWSTLFSRTAGITNLLVAARPDERAAWRCCRASARC